MRGRWIGSAGVAGFVLCAIWLSITVAFFSMVTSGGEANMELEIGPFLKLEDRGAVFFSRGFIGFGVVMLVLFFWKRRLGFVLAVIWSAWWGVVLASAVLNSPGHPDRVAIVISVCLFAASAWFAFARFRAKRSPAHDQP